MRTSDDICLLCKTKKADKTNSHIIPKFITKGLLNSRDKIRGYQMSTDKVDKETKYVQSSDAEDYILCSSCEAYFSLLETLFSIYVHNALWDIRKQGWFDWEDNSNGSLLSINRLNGLTTRLFLSSLLWRCSISQGHISSRFTLNKRDEDQLGDILMGYRSSNVAELKALMEDKVERFPFSFNISALSDPKNSNGRLVFLHPNSEQEGFFILNDYILTYTFDNDGISTFESFINGFSSSINVKILFVNSKYWNDFNDILVQEFTAKAIDYLRRENKKYLPMKK